MKSNYTRQSVVLALFFFCYISSAFAQSVLPPQPATPAGTQRILFSSITPSVNTGQDYSPWLNDNLDSLVQSVWTNNFIWVDVTIKFKQHSTISEFEFYDYQGVFTDNPDSIYAVNGTTKTFLGTFTGPAYMVFDDFKLPAPVQADAIIIHKYSNNIPQKIYVYGTYGQLSSNSSLGALKINNTTTSPVFSPTVKTYNASVSNATTSATITAFSADGTGSVKIGAAPAKTDSASFTVPLAVGPNIVKTAVKSQDGTITTTYQLTITRAGATIPVPGKATSGTLIDTGSYVKIPIDSTRWYVLNNISHGLGGLTNGVLNDFVYTGYGLMFSNYDAYYPIKKGEQIDLYQLKFYNYEGGLGPYPLTVSVIDSTGARTVIGTYSGDGYMNWVGPTPGNPSFDLNTPMKNIQYIVLNCWYQFPAEMELYGYYKAPPTQTPLVAKAYPLNQYFGVNAFEWNFEDPNNPMVVSPTLLAPLKAFTQVRHYMDWNKLESTQGEYTFDPVHSGGWNYDAMYKACKSNNITVLADLKTIPDWLIATYPPDQQDAENVPVPYGSDFSDPFSYILQAKVAFQYAARYGSNSAVSTSLLSVDPTSRWTADPVNTVKKGTALINYIECDNERDKWWKGRRAYQTAYEYAANLSAFYDGNKNTMGPGIGVKNADPNMQVVMGGLASADPSYVHAMIEWCRLYRGYKADGSINLCWDVINYHLYSNDATLQTGATTGVAPEISGTAQTAQSFIAMAHEYAADMPVWVTEAGFDANQGSIQRAPAIGSKTPALVEADWILRSSLLYARNGVQRVFYYEAYDDNAANPTQYASSGLINDDHTRRPAVDYLLQVAKQFGSYTFSKSISSSPVVDKYMSDAKPAYVVYLPTQTGKTSNYSLDLTGADSAYVYKPVAGASAMSRTKVKLTGGKLSFSISETPTFVVPCGTTTVATMALSLKTDSLKSDDSFGKGISLYPNPSANFVTVSLNDKTYGKVTMSVIDVNSGKVYNSSTVDKATDDLSQTFNIANVPLGVYLVQVKQGNQQTVKKGLKTIN